MLFKGKETQMAQQLGYIYQHTKEKAVAFTKLARWYDKVEKAGFKSFNTISPTIQQHYVTILNFFEQRSTNATAESFNAKIKAFRAQFRGFIPILNFLCSVSYKSLLNGGVIQDM